MRWYAVLVAAAAAHAQPLFTFDFDGEDATEGWRSKSNTTIEVRPPEPFAGPGAMRFTIDPSEFSYGWIHRPLPDVDFSNVAGISGVYRAPRHARGDLRLYLCLRSEGNELSYFRRDLGDLADSRGEWVEFYAALGDFRHERGPVRTIRPDRLGPPDLIQFLAGIQNRTPVDIDVDSVALVTAEDAAEVARRVNEARRKRLLLPESETTGPPHPRLLLTADGVAHYRAKASAGDERQAAYERLFHHAEQLLRTYDADDPLGPLYAFVESSELEGVAWRAAFEGQIVSCSYPIETLGAAYLLSGDERFGKHGARALVNAASRLTTDEPFLSRGFYYSRTFYVRALAFGYDWLWDQLRPEERRRVKATLLGFVADIHERSQTDGWGRRPLHRVWNWDPGLMGACGLGILALEGETHLAEQAILFDCRRHLRDYLTLGIDMDGCGHEGPNYLGYGIGAGVEFAEVLHQQGRGDLFRDTNYHLIPAWLIAETLPDGLRWNNLSDCGHGQRPYPVYLYACGRLAELAAKEPPRDGERWRCPRLMRPLTFLQQFSERPGERQLSYGALASLMGWAWKHGPGRVDPSGYDARTALAHVLLYEPVKATDDPARFLPPAMHFRGRGLVVCRTGFGPDDLHLAIEAGPHAAGHDQSDKGTFTLYAYGGDLAIDSGYGNDGDPAKSSSSFAHNVVLIDGQGQPMRYHNQSSGHVTGFFSGRLLDWVRVDATEAWSVRYDADWRPRPTSPVLRAERAFVLVRPSDGISPYVVVYDDIVKDGEEHEYTWQWHIPARMKFELSDSVYSAVPRPWELPALTSAPDAAGGSATFKFSVPETRRYVICGLVRAGGPEVGKSDSFFVSVDGGERLLWDLKTGPSLGWDAVSHRGEPAPRVFELTAAEHTIRLELRERQAEISRWLVLPEGAEMPVDPTATPKGAIAIEVSDAALGDPPFILREAGAITGPTASLDAFPVHPKGGRVQTGWFLTSREGSHPRLQYSVRARRPRFLFVLVPRKPGIPQPSVKALSGEGGVGAAIRWPSATDYVLFSGAGATFGPLAMNGSAAFVRVREGRATDWAYLDATRLAYAGRTLFHAQEPAVGASD